MSKRAAPSRSPSPARRRRHSEQIPQENGKGKGKDVETRLDELPSSTSQEGSGLFRSASGSLFSRFSFLSASTSSLSSSSTAVEAPKSEPTSPILTSPVLVPATTSPSRPRPQQVWYSSISNASISHNKRRRRPSCHESEPVSPVVPQPQPQPQSQPQKHEAVIVKVEDTFRELVTAEMDELNRIREEKERLTEEIEELRVRAELEGQGEVLREIRALRSEMGEIKTLRKEVGDLKAELEGVRAEVARGRTEHTHCATTPISAPPRISQPVQPQMLRSGDTSLSSTAPLMLGSWSQPSGLPATATNGTQVRHMVATPSLPLATTGYTSSTLSAPAAGSSTQPQVVLPPPKQVTKLSLVPTTNGAAPVASTSKQTPPITQAVSHHPHPYPANPPLLTPYTT
uniref:Uncharacterized protein n=1 Tax=Moniliophthora roreri TaxID=221103 RepID=A0A0W0FDS5_MONRR